MDKSTSGSPQFVFLIGAARSGTKFLRDAIACSEVVSRVPYDVNYVWRYRNESLPDDEIPAESANDEIRAYIRQTLTRMARRSKGISTPIVIEKSVSNVFRVPFIYSLFPEAKFVHLIRDGRDVAVSAARQWQTPSNVGYLLDKIRYFPLRNIRYALWFARNAIARKFGKRRQVPVWGPRYPGIEDDVQNLSVLELAAKQWSTSVAAADDAFALIPDRQKFAIRYEDLVSDPGSFQDLLEFLDIPDSERVISSYQNKVEHGKIGSWQVLRGEQQSAMLPLLETSLTRFGYCA